MLQTYILFSIFSFPWRKSPLAGHQVGFTARQGPCQHCSNQSNLHICLCQENKINEKDTLPATYVLIWKHKKHLYTGVLDSVVLKALQVIALSKHNCRGRIFWEAENNCSSSHTIWKKITLEAVFCRANLCCGIRPKKAFLQSTA